MIKIWVLMLLLPAALIYALDDCPYADTWAEHNSKEKQKLLKEKHFTDLSPGCFVYFLRRTVENRKDNSSSGIQLVEALDTYTRRNGFDMSLLFALASQPPLVDNIGSVDVREIWQSHNGSFREHLSTLSDKGMYQQADSLYQAMHNFEVLDIYDMIRWIDLKGVVGDFHGLGRLVCEVAIKDERMTEIARNKMHSQLADAQRHERNLSLQAYQDCYLSMQPPDSTDFGLWLASQYERYGFLKIQITVLTRFVPNRIRAGRQLLLAAHRRLSDGIYALARDAAKAAYEYIPDQETRRECASLAYRAYDALGNTDSALVWLNRADMQDPETVVHAVVMYQKAALYDKAAVITAKMSRSVQKDTLTLRQMVFQNQIKQASDTLDSYISSRQWIGHDQEALLWRVRLASFQAHTNLIPSMVDSGAFSPDSRWAGEILRLKYEALKLSSYPQAAKLWARLQLGAYTERLETVIDSFSITSFPTDIQNLLLCGLLDDLIQREMWGAADRALEQNAVESPDTRTQYYTAQVQYNLGRKVEARKTLEQLILNNPGDVFAGKARIYLMEIGKEPEQG